MAAWVLAVIAFFGGGALLAGYTGATGRPSTPKTDTLPAAPTQRPPPPELQPLVRSVPITIDIPAIKVHSPVGSLGTAADGTVEVPPLDKPNLTGWYRGSVTPGQTGNAVILGHVDAHRAGAAVFYHLGDLQPGDLISVTRADQSVVIFRVYGVASYARAKFPTTLVYGPNSRPELRLVTCGGAYNAKTHEYLKNIVAVATMVSTRSANG